ncbi:hypothetical protein PIB30_085253, partial [Stylosanthes scabra]|nr:hypothetical protein [Stylosanthes scabra]
MWVLGATQRSRRDERWLDGGNDNTELVVGFLGESEGRKKREREKGLGKRRRSEGKKT